MKKVSRSSRASYGHKTYGVDLDVIIDILRLDSQQQRSEPFERSEVSADPEEVDLPQSRTGSLRVVHAVPDTLKNGRERCDTDTGTTENGDFELEYILRGRTERTINVDSGKNLTQGDLFAGPTLLTLLAGWLLVCVAAKRLTEGLGEVTDHTNVDRDVVFLGCAGKREGMVLPDGDLRAAQEDVLSSTGLGVLLLDLNFANVAGVLDDLGDIRLVSSSYFTGNSLGQVRKSTIHPVLPEDTDTVAEGRKVGLNHAEGSVDGPEDEEDDEQMVHVPETFEVGATSLLRSRDSDRHERSQHNVTTPSRSSCKVGKDKAHESQVIGSRKLGKVVPMGDSVDPREEDDRPGDQLVEGDVLVERNNVVQRRTTSHGD